jgi:hypothetical protein
VRLNVSRIDSIERETASAVRSAINAGHHCRSLRRIVAISSDQDESAEGSVEEARGRRERARVGKGAPLVAERAIRDRERSVLRIDAERVIERRDRCGGGAVGTTKPARCL